MPSTLEDFFTENNLQARMVAAGFAFTEGVGVEYMGTLQDEAQRPLARQGVVERCPRVGRTPDLSLAHNRAPRSGTVGQSIDHGADVVDCGSTTTADDLNAALDPAAAMVGEVVRLDRAQHLAA